ncbi:hypothetical protein MRF4_25720 [Methylobacterium radiotolerans]|uniref:hypothetical protein n=1 Tax=Methylobacterium TaxID=407 RepID=UPI001A0305C9|nr:hypothetical protein [Parafilimonas terrae]
MHPIHHTVLLTNGSAQTVDLRQVAKVDGGTLVQGGPLPDTTITMADGTVYECTFLTLGQVITAMQAHGLA